MGKNRILIVLLFLGAIGTFLFQPHWAKAGSEKPLVVAIGLDCTTLDATLFRNRPDMILNLLIFDALFYRNPENMKAEPHLVKQLNQIGPTTWEIEIKQGVLFHDGIEMTAADVAFSLKRILNPEMKAPYRGSFTWIKEIKETGRYTIQILTEKPFGLVREMLTFAYILPKHYFQKGDSKTFASQPIGSGPYKVVKWEQSQQLILTANKKWWKRAPAINDIVIRIIPEASTRIAELLSGGVQIAWNIPVDQVGVIKDSKMANISARPILRVQFLVLDGNGRGGKTPLTDVRVRKAIQHAINVDDMVKHVLKGYAVRVNAGLNPLHFGYDASIPAVKYDPEKAKQLLQEAGYPSGFQLTFNTYESVPNNVSESVQAYLEAAGIKVNRKHFGDSSAFIRARNSGQLNGMFELSWSSQSVFDADQIFWPLLRSDDVYTYNTSPQIDTMLEEARFSLDQNKRSKIYSSIQKYILENAWWVPLYADYAIEGVNNDLDYQASGDELLRLFDAKWRR